MRQIQTSAPGGFDNLKLVSDLGDPVVGPGDVLVRVKANSLNYHDLAVVQGWIPCADGRVPISDGAGEVVAIGSAVTEFAVGDNVVSTFFRNWSDGTPPGDFSAVPGDGIDGYASELVAAPASAFTRAPAGYSHAEAATLTCAGLTAWRALFVDGPLKPGETVLVLGTGGVSIFALQFAKMMGARVIATSSSDEKIERLKALGADHTINYRAVPEWGAEVAKISGGGVDHVIEVGGGGTLQQSMVASRMGGHIAIIGVLGGMEAGISPGLAMVKQLRIQGLIVGSRKHQLDMIQAIDHNGLRPVIDTHFPLAEARQAFEHQMAGKHFGKIVLDL